jgi:pSer/pThr/pTyr-binding forkhead associated (FHA) protein
VLGRDPECDVVVADVTVSRRHAELRAVDGRMAVRDLGSSNGTSINGARVATGELSPGDTVSFGKVVFRLEGSAAERGGEADTGAEGTVVRTVVTRSAFEASLEATQLARILDLAKRLSTSTG